MSDWKENFENHGPKGLGYRKTGGKRTILTPEEQKQLADLVDQKYPKDVGLNGIRWTAQKAVDYCKQYFGKKISKDACRVALHRKGLTLKRPKKIDQGKSQKTG